MLSALPFSLGRTLNTLMVATFLAIGPAALASGSGGSGEEFHEDRFIAIVVTTVVLALVVVTAFGAMRARRAARAAGSVDGASAEDRGARRRSRLGG